MTPDEIAMSLRIMSFFGFLAVDFVFSLPVWIAMLQVAALQRVRAKIGKLK
jgi:hypothetical protein